PTGAPFWPDAPLRSIGDDVGFRLATLWGPAWKARSKTKKPQGKTGSMDAKTNLKAKLPSRHATEGPDRAPHRSFYYAMGLTRAQVHQPFVGGASCWNEAAPCN